MPALALTLVSTACVSGAGSSANTAAPVLLEPGEERRVAEQPVLGHLGVAGAHLARRQRAQHVGVGQHEARLVEGADQVLALRRVDAGLAADGAVHLRQQRGRDLHEAHAAAQDGRGEAGEVADHAAAERDDEIAALEAQLEQALAQRLELAEALRRLAGRQDDRADVAAARLQRRLERGEMMARDVLVGDDGAARRAEPRVDELARRAPAAPARSARRRRGSPSGTLTVRTSRVAVALIGPPRSDRRQLRGRDALDDLADDDLVRHVAAFDGDVGLRIDRDSASP